MIFDKFTYNRVTIPSVVIFAIGGSSMFFPYYRILGDLVSGFKCYNKFQDNEEQNIEGQYKNFRTKFFTEYDRSNPVTSEEAMNEYMNFLLSRS